MNHKKWIRLVCTVLALLLFVTGSGVSFAMAEQPDKETVLTEEQAATPETAESARLSLTVLDSDYSGSENGNIDESLFNTETDHAEIAAGNLIGSIIILLACGCLAVFILLLHRHGGKEESHHGK